MDVQDNYKDVTFKYTKLYLDFAQVCFFQKLNPGDPTLQKIILNANIWLQTR